MKKTVKVTIDIDTETPGDSEIDDLASDVYHIQIRQDPKSVFPSQYGGVISLAHEFGHLLGALFEMPGWTQDPRGSKRLYLGTSTHGQRLMASEREAWDLARLIPYFKQDEKESLISYQQIWEPAVYARRDWPVSYLYQEVK